MELDGKEVGVLRIYGGGRGGEADDTSPPLRIRKWNSVASGMFQADCLVCAGHWKH
jgi:hypothetical protein